MNTAYWSKRDLYNHVDKLHESLSVGPFAIDSVSLAKTRTKNLLIKYIPFGENSICGVLYKGNNSTSIALNSSRSADQQNFDCMHELIHYFFHDISFCRLICSDKTTDIKQDTYLEWQANEGAAQFLVPYQLFIPDYLKTSRDMAKSAFPNIETIEILSKKYFVSEKVIENRISSLNYEIATYMLGVPILKLSLYSRSKLAKRGWQEDHKKRYCRNCLAPIEPNANFCHLCGTQLLKQSDLFFGYRHVAEGAGYMKYKEIEIDEYGHVLECPKCHNKVFVKDGIFCHICGAPAKNACYDEKDNCDNYISPCVESQKHTIPGNARYCPYCGGKTTFFQYESLPSWEFEKKEKELKDEAALLELSDKNDKDDVLPF